MPAPDQSVLARRAEIAAALRAIVALQIGQRASIPVVHTVELLDWATGGPIPSALSHLQTRKRQ
jgi:glycolate oxidase iron-sulfur subunit